MKNLTTKIAILIASIFFLFNLTACDEENSLLLPDDGANNDQSALEKIVDDDETLQSFDLNYNEEEAMAFILGKTSEEIFPVKLGQRMKLVSKNLDVVFEGDTAYGTLKLDFEGMLFIVASKDSLNHGWDSLDLDVYEKPFQTSITRNLIFTKIDNSDNPLKNWKISAVSLAEGGTLTRNISIEKIVVYLPSGDTLNITDPTSYYLSRGPELRTLIPQLTQFEPVQVEVTITSAYEDADFVTLTYGAIRDRKQARAKKRLQLIDETFDGSNYTRVYKGDWIVHQFRGYRHAVINAFPWGVFKDSEAPVETNSWGIPYKVN